MSVERLALERSRHIDAPFPDGQSYRDVARQTGDFLRELAHDWEDRRVLLIAHSANKCALDYLLMGAALEELVGAQFDWQEGRIYSLPQGWRGRESGRQGNREAGDGEVGNM